MKEKFTLSDAVALLQNNLKWYKQEENKPSDDYEHGFVKGLEESIRLLQEFNDKYGERTQSKFKKRDTK